MEAPWQKCTSWARAVSNNYSFFFHFPLYLAHKQQWQCQPRRGEGFSLSSVTCRTKVLKEEIQPFFVQCAYLSRGVV